MTARVLAAAQDLVASPQPVVVLASLAALSVPTFSESCHVVVEEHENSDRATGVTGVGVGPHPGWDEAVAYRISNPPDAGPHPAVELWAGVVGQQITATAVTTALRVPALAGAPHYRGAVVHHWNSGYRPGPADAALAQLLVGQAVALIHTERLHAMLTHTQTVVTQLQEAVASNRDIGAAIGILMHAHHLTYEEAFRALVVTSRNSNTKLRTVSRRVLADRALLAAPDENPRRR